MNTPAPSAPGRPPCPAQLLPPLHEAVSIPGWGLSIAIGICLWWALGSLVIAWLA